MTIYLATRACIVENAMDRAAACSRLELSARVHHLSIIAAAAPLLGGLLNALLIVDSVRGLGCERSACMAAFAERLAGSLMPTAFGLAIAIPSYIAYRSFADFVDDYVAHSKALARQILCLLASM